MRCLAVLLLLTTANPALASGCWKGPLGDFIRVGVRELVVNDELTCEIGSIEGPTYRAGCIDDDGRIGYISVTESGNTATVIWNDETPLAYRRCP